jgi:hypothetical protein
LIEDKPKKCHVGRIREGSRKVAIAILFPQEIRREDEEPTKDGN